MSIHVPQEALAGLTWPGDGFTTLLPEDKLILHTGDRMKLKVERKNQTLIWFATGEEELDLGEHRTPETVGRWMREIAEHYNLDATLHIRRTLSVEYRVPVRQVPVALS